MTNVTTPAELTRKHYRTGDLYRVISPVYAVFTAVDLPVLLYASLTTNNHPQHGNLVPVYAAHGRLFIDDRYAPLTPTALSVLYVSLVDGALYLRDVREFNGKSCGIIGQNGVYKENEDCCHGRRFAPYDVTKDPDLETLVRDVCRNLRRGL